MKKIIFSAIGIIGLVIIISGTVFVQGMMGGNVVNSNGHTAREEAEGKVVWEKLQAKQTTCVDLSDDNFGTLGEYFMGQSIGDTSRHIVMNEMIKRMMGEKGEEQMHAVMGKRLSGCDTSVAFPTQNVGFLPMMNMMWGGWSSPTGLNQGNPEGVASRLYGAGNSMMNFGFMSFGWIFMIFWWVLIIAGIIALIKWLTAQSHGSHGHEKSPLEILKERYAKGEIDKKEFEDKKKDLT